MTDEKKKLTLKEAMAIAKEDRISDAETPTEKPIDKVTPFKPETTPDEELVDKKPKVSIQEVMQLKKNLKNGTPVDHARTLAKFKDRQIKKSGS
jgi:hypothetical protein